MLKPLCLLAILLGGCSSFAFDKLEAVGAKAAAFCVEGSGPPLSGSGHVAGASASADFVGVISVSPECAIQLESR